MSAAWSGEDSGQYLSPEPLLQSPTYVRLMAQSGMSVPTYSYAANNPLRFVDPTGLDILPSPGDANLWGGIDRLRSTPTGRELYDYLHNHRPEKIPLSSMEPEFVQKDSEGWVYGKTRLRRRGGRVRAACSAVTDPAEKGTGRDPALNIAEELAHVRAELDFPNIGDALQERYTDQLVQQVAKELGINYGPSGIHTP